jgi:hypothetical protein
MEYTKEIEKTISHFVNENEEIIITKKQIYKEHYQPYSMVGTLHRPESRSFFMDFIDILNTVSKSELNLFTEIKNTASNQIGIAVMADFADHQDIKNINTRLRHLIAANLIMKVVAIKITTPGQDEMRNILYHPLRYTYMINPYLIIPWKYEMAKQIWNLLKAAKEKSNES